MTKMKYNLNDRLPAAQLALYAMQWLVLAIAVVSTSVFFVPDAERLFFAQRLFAVMGITGLMQVTIGHRLPLVVGPAAVLLVGVLASMAANADTSAIYSSIAVGGVLITLLGFGGLIGKIQRLFTPRIVVVILMLIALTLSPVIAGLVFPRGASTEEHIFGLCFALVGSGLMVVMNRKLRGVAKSLVIPIALVVGSALYYAIFEGGTAIESNASWRGLIIEHFTLDWSLIIAFVICYIALLINDIGSMESLGGMLAVEDMPRRLKRGIRITGVMNIVAGSMGVLGPVNFSMSPGIIASTGCASRYALIPATVILTLCALSPELVWALINIPNPVIGVILLFLMGTQLAASFEMMHSTKSAGTFADALTIGLPLMIAMLCTMMPKGIVPQAIEPLITNGFAMGVVAVLVMEHVINRSGK